MYYPFFFYILIFCKQIQPAYLQLDAQGIWYCRHEPFIHADRAVFYNQPFIYSVETSHSLGHMESRAHAAKKTVTTLRSESRKERNSDHYCNSSTGLTHPSLSRRVLKCWYNRRKWHKETLELPKRDWRSVTFIISSRNSSQNWISSSPTDQNTPASKESTVQMFWVTMINTRRL